MRIWPTLDEVFSMSPAPTRATYVDRGGLDRKVRSNLKSGIHVAIHGESKHGKSWLRGKTLPDSKIARVQCVPGMSAQDVLTLALGRLDAYETVKRSVEDSDQSDAHIDLKLAKTGGASGHKVADEQLLLGHDRTDLAWVAEQFKTGKRIPVFEDFHNLASAEQRVMAKTIKALGEWRVPCVIVGIWTDGPRLKLYNGELDGRVADLRVAWSATELREVLDRGCRALNVRLSDTISERIVRDAYTSVGLVQELARATLELAGVTRRRVKRLVIDDGRFAQKARNQVVAGIADRFEPFLERMPKAIIPGADPAISGLLTRFVAGASPQTLFDGVPVRDLFREFSIDIPTLIESDVVTALQSIDVAQRDAEIDPAILAWDPAHQRLILGDRRLLLFLKERPVRPS